MIDQVEIVTLPVSAWPAYRELRLRALSDAPQAFGGSYAEAAAQPETYWQDRLREVASGARWLLFARRGVRLVGMVGAARTDEDRAQGRATIVGSFVDPGERGRGIGRRLLTAVLAQLAATGEVMTARLTVNATQVAAVRLYEDVGFQEVAEGIITLGDGRPHRVVMLDKRLAAPGYSERRPTP